MTTSDWLISCARLCKKPPPHSLARETRLQYALNEILEAKKEVAVVYMDFRKAFNLASHNSLLKKLNSVGITGKLWSWLREYLQQSFQYVRIGDSMSTLYKVISGVPQGSAFYHFHQWTEGPATQRLDPIPSQDFGILLDFKNFKCY